MLVLGDKEADEGAVNVRKYGEQKSESAPLAQFIADLEPELKK